ncbi:MAG: hypothetical protein HY023_07020 [Chloroflexi bacterium]|nr:hypothetical protein [Chloroflexota bacterium]
MNTSSAERHEQGQAIVLLALAMIGLLAFSGLALDGGRVYNERRRAQNAADNAALAAALKAAQNQNYTTEGLAVAAQNDFNNDGATNSVTVNKPPTLGTYAGNNNYVEVVITENVPTSFIRLVYNGPVALSARAVALAQTSTTTPLMTGDAVVALDPGECDALQFHGNGTTEILNGGAFSNSDAEPPPASCHSGRATGSSVIISNGGLNLVGDWDSGSACVKDEVTDPCGTATIQTHVTALDLNSSALTVDETSMNNKCSALPYNGSYTQNGGEEIIDAGQYTGIQVRASGTLTMTAGLYCITGSTGFDTAGGKVTGTGVLIYLWSGPFETNGNATNVLTAPTATSCTTPPSGTVEICDFQGLLLYAKVGNTSTMKINGGAGTTMTGTFFAPSAPIELTGDSGTFALHSQIIGNTVDVGGNGTLDIDYQAAENFANSVPPQIKLVE